MADANYWEHATELSLSLKRLDVRATLLVICLDAPCVQLAAQEGIKAISSRQYFHSEDVGLVKLRSLVELTRHGYYHLFTDLDIVFLRDPFKSLLPAEDASWDMQFQRDKLPGKGCDVNIGFMYSRPTAPTLRLWNDSLTRLVQEPGWDQQRVNQVLCTDEAQYASSTGLRLVRLDLSIFVSFMFHRPSLYLFEPGRNDWQTSTYRTMMNNATILHLTMVGHSGYVKRNVAQQLGLWSGVRDCYYAQPRLLSVGHTWRGSFVQLQDMMRRAIYLAELTNRTLHLPLVFDNEDGNRVTPWHCMFHSSGLAGRKIADPNFMAVMRTRYGRDLYCEAEAVRLDPDRWHEAQRSLVNVSAPLLILYDLQHVPLLEVANIQLPECPRKASCLC